MTRTVGKPGMNYGAPPAAVATVEGNPAAEALAALGGARGMMQTRTNYITAVTVQVPRDLESVRKRVIQEATYSREGFFYAWTQKDKSSPTGEKLIEGTSIDGAMILLRNWGNAVCEPDLVDETPSHWMLRATVVDLETGFTSARLFRQRKTQHIGRHDPDRALDIQFQIAQSKALRNSIVRCVPEWLVDEAMEAAKGAAARRYADVAKHAAEAIAAYDRDFKVTLAQLERKIGKKRPDWIPADLVLLRAIYKGLKEGLSSVGQEFSSDEPEATAVAAEAPEDVPSGKDLGQEVESYATQATPQPSAVQTEPVPPDEAASIAKALESIEKDKAALAAEPPAPDFQPPTAGKPKK